MAVRSEPPVDADSSLVVVTVSGEVELCSSPPRGCSGRRGRERGRDGGGPTDKIERIHDEVTVTWPPEPPLPHAVRELADTLELK